MARLITPLLVLALFSGGFSTAAAQPKLPVKDLVPLLKDKQRAVRLRTIQDLGGRGTAAKAAAAALFTVLQEDQEQDLRLDAAKALAHIGPAAVPWLIKGVKDKDWLGRQESVRGLAMIGPEAADAVPALAHTLKDPNPRSRRRAAYALGEIGPAAGPAAEALVELLTDKDAVRAQAVRALAKIGSAAVPDLCTALKATRRAVRHWAATALAMIGPGASKAVPDLTHALKDSDAEVRTTAAAALAEIGPQAAPAVLPLIDALTAGTRGLRTQAAHALARIGAAAVADLLDALQAAQPSTRSNVLYVIGQIGPRAKTAVPALIEALADKDPKVRPLAALALGRIGTAARKAVPAVTRLQKAADPVLRIAATLALTQIEPNNKKALERLNDLFAGYTVAKPPPGLLAQLDVGRQTLITRYIDFYVEVNNHRFGDGLSDRSKWAMAQLGPDAIPAMVRALNEEATFNTGIVPTQVRTFYFV